MKLGAKIELGKPDSCTAAQLRQSPFSLYMQCTSSFLSNIQRRRIQQKFIHPQAQNSILVNPKLYSRLCNDHHIRPFKTLARKKACGPAFTPNPQAFLNIRALLRNFNHLAHINISRFRNNIRIRLVNLSPGPASSVNLLGNLP